MPLRQLSDELTAEELSAISHNTVQLGARDPLVRVSTIVGWAIGEQLVERMLERSALSGVDSTSLQRVVDVARTPVVNQVFAEWGNQVEPIYQRGWEWDGTDGWSGLLSGFVDFANRSGRRHVEVWA